MANLSHLLPTGEQVNPMERLSVDQRFYLPTMYFNPNLEFTSDEERIRHQGYFPDPKVHLRREMQEEYGTGGFDIKPGNHYYVNSEVYDHTINNLWHPGQIAGGAWGRVIEGWDDKLERPVAVKILAGKFRDEDAMNTPDGIVDNGSGEIDFSKPAERTLADSVKEYFYEARKLANAEHPNIIRIYDLTMLPIKDEKYLPAIVMERADYSVRDIVDLSTSECLRIGDQMADALDYLHEKGMVHQDVKPDNILVVSGVYKLADFGIVHGNYRLPEEPYPAPATEGYTSPEQIAARSSDQLGDVDGRADEYALAYTMFELLSGTNQLFLDQDGERAVSQKQQDYKLYKPDSVSNQVYEVFQKALSFDREGRYSSCTEFMLALRKAYGPSYEHKPRPTSRPTSPWGTELVGNTPRV